MLACVPVRAKELPPLTLPAELETVHSLEVNGLDRQYRVLAPPVNDGSPLPLVLVFHGGGMTSKMMAQWTWFHEEASRQGYLVAYLDGTRVLWFFGIWNVGSEPPQTAAEKKGIDDVAYVRAVIGDLRKQYNIDPRRIYATGVSLGGMFSYHLACTMPDTFAAIAVVAGSMTTARCAPNSPVAVMVIHGVEDQNVTISGERGKHTAKDHVWPPVRRGLQFWSRKNGCAGVPQETFRSGEAACWSYGPCASDMGLEYCAVRGGHHWPGQGKPMEWQKAAGDRITNFPANDWILSFFGANAK